MMQKWMIVTHQRRENAHQQLPSIFFPFRCYSVTRQTDTYLTSSVYVSLDLKFGLFHLLQTVLLVNRGGEWEHDSDINGSLGAIYTFGMRAALTLIFVVVFIRPK